MKQVKVKKKKLENKGHILKVEFSNEVAEIPLESNDSVPLEKRKYSIQFFISIIIAIIFVLILLYQIYKSIESEKLSKALLNNYSLTTLYHDNNNIEIEKQSQLIETPFVIGMIKIGKIGLNYPILSESNDELLKISLCRFAGPMPNEYGNLCIAGHNYVDNKFFSNLDKLKNDDLIEIYDLTGRKVNYCVFKKYEVKSDDLSCTKQNASKERIITLLTCNNVNGKRIVVKAKEMEEKSGK